MSVVFLEAALQFIWCLSRTPKVMTGLGLQRIKKSFYWHRDPQKYFKKNLFYNLKNKFEHMSTPISKSICQQEGCFIFKYTRSCKYKSTQLQMLYFIICHTPAVFVIIRASRFEFICLFFNEIRGHVWTISLQYVPSGENNEQ